MTDYLNLKKNKKGGVMIEITCIECGDKFNKFQGSLEERTCMTCILKAEDPDVIRPAPVTTRKPLKIKRRK